MKSIQISSSNTSTIIENIRDGMENEYIVRGDGQLTLILIGRNISSESTVAVRLIEPGAQATIIGFMIGQDHQKIILHTTQRHEASDTASTLLVKSILTDDASFLYNGGIRVEPNAQKTDAYQRNENLLLSEHARAESKPSLEILANDVRCTHGATISSIQKDHQWYLATRGLNEEESKRLILVGFFEHAIAKISDTIAQKKVRNRLW